ncbi:MAG: PEP-CTERM sorting domain-containing protein [Phycisphaerales bacterium]|nr:PEP-CTERM sorting domain-containing protein [Phycisphaerales bacterium]
MERTLLSGLRTIALGAVVLGMGAAVNAAPITIANASFETSVGLGAAPAVGYLEDAAGHAWINNGEGDRNAPTLYVRNNPDNIISNVDGSQFLLLLPGVHGEAYQNLSASVDTSKTYTLEFLAGGAQSAGAIDGGYLVQLLAGSTVVASHAQTAAQLSVNTMTNQTLNYTPSLTDSGAFTIEVWRMGNDSGTDKVDAGNITGYLGLDNFRLTETAVPEPASMALLGLGASALVMRRRRMA